jgi:hypothetical protein
VTVGAAGSVGRRVTVAVVVAVAVCVGVGGSGLAVGVRVIVGRDVASVGAEVSVAAGGALDVADGGAIVRDVSRDRAGEREG